MTNKQTVKDTEFSNSKVQPYAKQGFWKIVFVMVGFTFFSPSMIAGGKLGLGMDAGGFILAIALGNLFLACYTGLLAFISQKTALNLDLLAQHSFGKIGSYIPSALISITQMGWFGVGVAMLSLPLAAMLPQNFLGVDNVVALTAIIGILMTITAAMGIKALAIFGTVAVPLILILGVTSNVISVNAAGGIAHIFGTPSTPLAMSVALTLVIGNFISGGTATPNFARFGKTANHAVTATVLAFFVGNIIMFVFGAVGAAVYGEADIFNVLIIQGLTIPAILTLGLNIWSTNNNALYTSGLGFAHMAKVGVRLTTVIAGLIGTVFAVFLYNNFVGYLTILGGMIPPVGVVIIMHYFTHKKQYDFDHNMVGMINWPALIALVLGVMTGLVITDGITPLNSVIVTAVVYLSLDRIFKVKGWYKSLETQQQTESAHDIVREILKPKN